MPVVRLVATCGPAVGRGHVNRTLALADGLRRHAVAVEMELLAGDLTLRERGRADALGMEIIPAGAHATAPDLVVLDVPGPTDVAARWRPERLVVFDDADRFAGTAAMVIQPSLPTWSGPGTAGRVLAGFRHVPVDPAYRDLRGAARRERGSPASVIACFGGSDPANVTGRLAGPLYAALPSVEVVVGATYRGPEGDRPGLVVDPLDLPDRLAAADLAILGAGTMKFEVACLGRPAILVAVADDQLAVGSAYAATGAAIYLGDGRTIDPDRVVAAAVGLLADPARLARVGRTAADLIDGRGAARVAAEIVALIDAAG